MAHALGLHFAYFEGSYTCFYPDGCLPEIISPLISIQCTPTHPAKPSLTSSSESGATSFGPHSTGPHLWCHLYCTSLFCICPYGDFFISITKTRDIQYKQQNKNLNSMSGNETKGEIYSPCELSVSPGR